MPNTSVIIIGAGAAGLMAARTIAKSGKKVIVLEARNRTGGRIHTLGNTSFFKSAELGAEFVHGDLPVTLNLLNEAGIRYGKAGGEMYRLKNGRFEAEEEQVEGWDELMNKLEKLDVDTNIADFLDTHFADTKYAELRKSVKQYVAGYDSADPALASAFALRREWADEDYEAQHRIPGGYCALINFLASECKRAGGEIILNAPVTKISLLNNDVKVQTAHESYTAQKVIVALPLGVLQAGDVVMTPPQPLLTDAFKNIGFGAIIKVLVQFSKPFWEQLQGGRLKGAGFFFSEEEIPTWWTQAPQHSALLTGWLGGDKARQLINASVEELWQIALRSLSNLFNTSPDNLKDKVIAWHITNWTAEPYTRGSYAYDTVASPQARQLLKEPVQGKLYFAGEYLYNGPAMGTVEAALQSGLDIGVAIAESND